MANKRRKKAGLSSSQQPTNSARKTSFLDLSAELRNQVYALLLRQDKPLNAASWDAMRSARLQSAPLFRVNRQIYNEAISFFYGGCEFGFLGRRGRRFTTSPRHFFREFLRVIGTSIIHLRCVRVPHMTKSTIRQVLHGLKGAHGLRIMKVSYWTWRSISAVDMAEGFLPLLKAQVKSQAAANIRSATSIARFEPFEPQQADRAEGYLEEFKAAVQARLYG